MNESDKQRFRGLMEEAAAAYGQDLSGKLPVYWRVLAQRMDIDTLSGAMDAHMADPQRGRFFPLPADLIAACEQAMDGHPTADEAWALCLQSFDEAETVCLTQQILEARTVAARVLDAGDKIGARMAFRAAYERLLRHACARPDWHLSLGHDPDQRMQAAHAAVAAGRISADAARALLPPPTEAHGPAAHVAALLAGKVVTHPSAGDAVTRRRIAELRAALGNVTDTSSARAETMRKLGDMLGGQPANEDTPRQRAERMRRERISDAKAKAAADLSAMTERAS